MAKKNLKKKVLFGKIKIVNNIYMFTSIVSTKTPRTWLGLNELMYVNWLQQTRHLQQVLISWSQVLNFLGIFLQENSVSETSLLLICVWIGLHFKSKLRIPYQTGKLPICVGLRLVSEKTIKSNTEISFLFYFSQESEFLLNITSRATKPFFFSVTVFFCEIQRWNL